MRKIFILLFLWQIIFSDIYAQEINYQIQLKNTTFTPTENLGDWEQFRNQELNKNYYKNGFYAVFQFYQVPNKSKKRELKSLGVELLEYLPQRAFVAFVQENNSLSMENLAELKVRSLVSIEPNFKISPRLSPIPDWAIQEKGKVDVIVHYYKNIIKEDLSLFFQEQEISVIDKDIRPKALHLRIKQENLQVLASFPQVWFIEPLDPPAELENREATSNHRNNWLYQDYVGGRKYNGEGVSVIMGDDGMIGPHIDYQGRFTHNLSNDGGNHGDHVAGIIMGAGNLNPLTRGNAWGAHLEVYSGWSGINNIPNAYNNQGVVITSQSLGNGCNAGYTSFAQQVDQQIRENSALMHVFSAGNSGNSNCGTITGWYNVTGGVKVGKNVIAVGNLTKSDALASSSSRGPSLDGRLKPEVCAVGTSVYAPIDPNNYGFKTGTSMACPAVSGNLACLYQAYRQMNNGNNPNSALIKGIVMNTADDLGNAGPDYQYGYGRINARRAIEVLENQLYFEDSLETGENNIHNIIIPVGTKQVKVMLYWNDYEGSIGASTPLVNDLNMTLDDGTTTYQPWVLDNTPNVSNLDAPATRGIDNINNSEQITIDDPIAGNYTININGFNIPEGPQKYVVIYEFVQDEIVVTFPAGGETFNPSETERIRWDAFGNTGTFSVEYSSDNGTSWNVIDNSVVANRRFVDWTVPAINSGEMLVRVSRAGLVSQSDTSFAVLAVPENMQVALNCPSITITWDAVAGVNEYEVFRLGEKYMESIGTSTTTSFSDNTLQEVGTYWYAVRAMGANNAQSRRTNAQSITITETSCPSAIDARMTDIISPATVSSCLLSQGMKVEVEIENVGTGGASISNFPVFYQLGNEPPVMETFTGTITAGNSTNFTFTSLINVPSGENQEIRAWTELAGDNNPFNDSNHSNFEVLEGQFSETPLLSENFDNFTICNNDARCQNLTCELDKGWVNLPNTIDDTDWVTNNSGTPSSNTGPSSDFSGTGHYLYVEASSCFSQEAILLSPCFNLTYINNPILSFRYHMRGSNMGTLHIDIFMDGSWQEDIMTAISGDQGNTWHEQIIDLNSYDGLVQLRFRAETGPNFRSDFAIDEINLTGTLLTDAGVASFAPNDICDLSENTEVDLIIQNFGTTDIPVISGTYEIRKSDNTLVKDGNFTTSAMTYNEVELISIEADLSEIGETYSFQAQLNPPSGDILTSNDNYNDNLSGVSDLEINRNIDVLQATMGWNTYQWFRNETLLAGETASSLSVTETGVYKVLASSATCEDSVSIEVNVIVSNPKKIRHSNLEVYPNPTQSSVRITLQNDIRSRIQSYLINPKGQIIQTFTIEKSEELLETNLDLSDLESGVYLLQLQQDDFLWQERIVKE